MNNSSTKLYNVLMGSPTNNAIGRTVGMQIANGETPGFFQKRWKSLDNAIGTTGAALYESGGDLLGAGLATLTGKDYTSHRSEQQNKKMDETLESGRTALEDIVKKYGYDSQDAFWDDKQRAEKEIYGKYGYDIDKYWDDRSKIWSPAKADSDAVKNLEAQREQVIAGMSQEDADRIRALNNIENELRGQTSTNAQNVKNVSDEYIDYVKNNDASKRINQDPGKFLGSAINTMSTAADLTGLSATPLANAIQGGVEGVADELEQSGFQDFDAGRAAQNAAIGATTGLVTGSLNKGINNALAKRGGNLFKGGNALTRGLNDLGSKTALGRVGSTLATGAARGAVSGAVGGATGAGLSSAMNGVDLGQGISNAIQGAVQGAGQGAIAGGTMAGVNMALSNTPGVGKFYNNLQNVKSDWDKSGSNFDERLTNTFNSGDSKIGDWLNRRTTSKLLRSAGNIGNSIQDINTPTTELDAWDRLAQQKGYNNYDEVIESYLAANPGVELNPNGAAGQILTWLDENSNTPTTAAGWAKRAGQRIVEDANERGVGMSIKDVNQDSPETQIYRSLTEQNVTDEELPETFVPEARNQMAKRNKLQSVGEQLINTSRQQKYRSLYDSLDAKTAQRAVDTNAPETLAKMGIQPENYLEAAKTSNYVNQVVSDLAKNSNVKVMDPDMPTKLLAAADDVVFSGSDAPNKFNRAVRQIVADGSSPDEYSASYLLEKSREFGNKAVNVKGNSDDSKALRTAYNNVKYVLRDAATDALANANITGDDTNANIAKGLAKMGANQKVVDYYTSDIDGKAPTARDYIRRSSTFEQARDMGNQVAAEKLTRSASKAPTRGLTRLWRATGLDEPLDIVLSNTVAPLASGVTKAAGTAIKGVGDLGAKIAGNDSTPASTETTPVVANTNYNPATQIYNAIGRTEGLTNAEQARTANYLTSAAQDVTVPNTGVTSLEGLISPSAGTTSVYNSVYGSQPTTQFVSQEDERATYFFPPTGDYWADMLSRAMRRAKNAEDYTSLGSLYEMYQDAISKNSTGTSETKLTSTQQRANAAMDSLDRLSNMTPDLAYNLSNIPVLGNIATLGGNDYEAEAKSLAQQIGYMVSGSNIKDSEAEAIGKSYVPQPWDNEQVRQNKLRRAYSIIQQYQNGYAA